MFPRVTESAATRTRGRSPIALGKCSFRFGRLEDVVGVDAHHGVEEPGGEREVVRLGVDGVHPVLDAGLPDPFPVGLRVRRGTNAGPRAN